MEIHEIKVIARIRSDFKTKFGIPRQSGLVEELTATVVFEPEFRNPDALRGLEGFSHLWLISQCSENVRDDWAPMVRPPRLGGNQRLGVFATRSPFRPNSIGLSCVKILGLRDDPALGTVIDYLYEKTGCIWIPSLMHASMNASAMPLMFLLKSGNQHLSVLGPNCFGLLGCLPVIVLAVIILVTTAKKRA